MDCVTCIVMSLAAFPLSSHFRMPQLVWAACPPWLQNQVVSCCSATNSALRTSLNTPLCMHMQVYLANKFPQGNYVFPWPPSVDMSAFSLHQPWASSGLPLPSSRCDRFPWLSLCLIIVEIVHLFKYFCPLACTFFVTSLLSL